MMTMKYLHSMPNFPIVQTAWYQALYSVKTWHAETQATKTMKTTRTPVTSTLILMVSISYNNLCSLLNIISYSVS
jgi:hypothetical protein